MLPKYALLGAVTKYSTFIDTKEGRAHVITKDRWLGLLPMPHTGVLPHPCSAADVKRLGTVIKWTTNDPSVLKDLHEAIVSVVQEVGVLGLVDFANVAKMFGGGASGMHMLVQMAAEDGVQCPIPDNTLKFIKEFQ